MKPNRPSPKPRRAEPLQPDRPGRGDRQLPELPAPAPSDEHARRLREQSDAAIDNARDGFG